MKECDLPVRGHLLYIRPLREEHNGSTACNDAECTTGDEVDGVYVTHLKGVLRSLKLVTRYW
jgi:hypothetical protein